METGLRVGDLHVLMVLMFEDNCELMFRNCQYLIHYHSTDLPLPVYNHNLDKILRCDGKCDPDRVLPQPFPLFQEERAHINSWMNSTIVTYNQCLTAVGIISPLEEPSSLNATANQPRGKPLLETNLTTAGWGNSSDVKWSTCASLKTFVRLFKSSCQLIVTVLMRFPPPPKSYATIF